MILYILYTHIYSLLSLSIAYQTDIHASAIPTSSTPSTYSMWVDQAIKRSGTNVRPGWGFQPNRKGHVSVVIMTEATMPAMSA